ncbi:MAG TPA: FapA family protein [Clostridia bacterium]|nr:FapA family protein [Clostridia bacterium]
MKKFSNLGKIEDVVASFLEDLGIKGTGKGNEPEKIINNYYINENDGLLSITEGKLSLEPPKQGGNWPTIKSCKNVSIKLKGREIREPIVVKNVDDIEIEPKNKPAESKFYLCLSPDNTEAILETEFSQGENFYIKDMEGQHELIVEAIHCKTILPPYIDEKSVYKELRKMGIPLEIDKSAVTSACRSLTNSRTTVVRGEKMIPPVDGRVKYMFDNEERIYKEKSETGELDFFYKGDINSVEEGSVLATIIPPVPGKPGLTVTGNIIPAPEGKHAKIYVGQGAGLINDGQAAVATINGRPVTKGNKKIICVISELIVRGDVDIKTGHVNFKGDVKILGNVAEGLEVRAAGKVFIRGSVFHAKVYGGNGVYINNNLVGGSVYAGGDAAEYKSMLYLLEKLKNKLKGVKDAFNQLKNNKKFSTEDLEIKGHGCFIKLIIEMRFSDIPKNLGKLYKMMPQENDRKKEGIWPVVELMYNKFSGLGPLQIQHIDEITKYKNFLDQIIKYIRESADEPANVSVNYCQNAVIKATGDVVIRGSGAYHSKIHSGGKINIRGFCRGGKIYGGTKIIAETLGSEMGVPTLVTVPVDGKIMAEELYPNVVLGIGGHKRKNTELKKYVQFVFKNEIVEQPLLRRDLLC